MIFFLKIFEVKRQLVFCDRVSSFFAQVFAVLCRFSFVVPWVPSFIKDASEADMNCKLPKINWVENKIKVALYYKSVSAVGYKERSLSCHIIYQLIHCYVSCKFALYRFLWNMKSTPSWKNSKNKNHKYFQCARGCFVFFIF